MPDRTSNFRRAWITIAKIGLAAAILVYLFYQVRQNQGFSRLVTEPKDWRLLAAALVCTFVSINLSFVRWHVLVSALGLPFRLVDALRLGSLGFALNFVSLGSIGGDLFKAILLAKRYPGRRTEAVATVMADRVLGLLMMLVLASGAILVADFRGAPVEIAILCRTILFVAAAALAGAALLLFVPALTGEWIRGVVSRVPLVGETAGRLVGAVEAYRDQKGQLLWAAMIGLVVDALFVMSFYLVARGLPVHAPTLAQHMLIVPVANMAGAIPATPSGLGTLELAVETLYQAVAKNAGVMPGDGTLVAIGQRVTMIAVALIGLAYYLGHRVELREVIHEAEAAESA